MIDAYTTKFIGVVIVSAFAGQAIGYWAEVAFTVINGG